MRHYPFPNGGETMATAASGPALRAFFDEATNTVTYLAWDPATKRGAVIDPVLDWDNRSGEAGTDSADAVLRAAAAEGVAVDWALETHVHADHLTAAPYVKARTGAPIGIGERIRDVQTIFREVMSACRALEAPQRVAYLGPVRATLGGEWS